MNQITGRRHPEFPLGYGRNSTELPPHDPRDENFLMEARIPRTKPRPDWRYWWSSGWWGDQGSAPECVAYAGLHYLEDGPITHAPRGFGEGPVLVPHQLYKECQRNDEWPGESYAGTSVRALMKVFQKHGLIKSYHWAWDLETVVDYLLTSGPVVVGTWWYREMFYPDEHGLIKIHGGRVGGHAYLLNGVNLSRKYVRIKNSWGRQWGRKGHAWIAFHDLERLIREDGEAAIAIENTPEK